jgi:hypothetical protein
VVTPGSRLAAALAAICLIGGFGYFAWSVVSSLGWWYGGFVSEAGVSTASHAPAYRIGILTIAAGLVLLAVALRRILPAAAGLVLLGGVFATTSAAVSCSPGCPLPPYQTPTFADLVHGAASIAGVLAIAAAIALISWRAGPSALRTASRAWLVLVVPLGALAAFALLALGRGYTAGFVERALLVCAVGWSTTAAVTVLTTRRAGQLPAGAVASPIVAPRP